MLKYILFSFLFFFISTVTIAQQLKVKVIDIKTKQSLAFVNIKFDDKQNGVATDIDGYFILKDINCCTKLKLSYIGYADTSIAVSSIDKIKGVIAMRPSKYELSTVTILPGENPAFTIIRKALENKKQNNPEQFSSFSYKAYHKFILTADPESIEEALADTTQLDSAIIEMDEFLKSQHILLSESVSERYFKFPDKNKENVIATRMSGLDNPFFAILGNQLQSFNFYSPRIDLLDKHYINPLTNASLKKYFYLLEDSIFSDFDTTYIISFRPYKGTNFDGLRGQLHISSHGFALKNIIAEPADTASDIGIRIQQKFDLIDGTHWFPVQLNSDLTFYTLLISGTYAKGIARSYIRNIEINKKPDTKVRFNNTVMELSKASTKPHSQEFWNSHRINKLDSVEMNTYHVMDSIGKAEKFDEKLWIAQTLVSGRIPWGPIDFELNKFMKLNRFEGYRMGIGVVTNDRVSSFVNIGAYGAWATKDKEWKYGGKLIFNLYPANDLKLKFNYKNDVFESAKQYDFGKIDFLSSEQIRALLVNKMVYHQTAKSKLSFRALPHSAWEFTALYSQVNSPDNYQYVLSSSDDLYEAKGDFNFAEIGLGWRFAFKEKFYRNENGLISMGTKHPIFNFHYTQGFSGVYGSELDYHKLDLQIDYNYYISFLGRSSWRLTAGKALGKLPWYKLYNGKGSFVPWYVESPNTFGTMHINEFLSDEYVALYFRHNFGSLLFGDKPFIPQPAIVTSFVIGQLSNSQDHRNISFNTLEKGYYESGLLLNSILKSGITNIGFGVFYRWGPYAFIDEKDNFAFKFTMGYSI